MRVGQTFRERCEAFSLIEVVLAIGVFSFTLVVVFALLPIGLNLNRESHDESFAVNAISTLVNARRATPLDSPVPDFNLPGMNAGMGLQTNTVYLNEDYASTNQSAALYKATVVFRSPPAESSAPFLMHCQVTWPALAANPRGQVETLAAIPQATPIP